jgi:hypothetical protein
MDKNQELREALQDMEIALIGYLHQNDITKAALAKCRAALAAPAAPMCHAGLSQFANGEDAGQPAQAVDARKIMFVAYSRCISDDRLSPDQIADVLLSAASTAATPDAAHADDKLAEQAHRMLYSDPEYANQLALASAHAQQTAATSEPVAELEVAISYHKIYAQRDVVADLPIGEYQLYLAPVAVAPSDATGKADAANAGGGEGMRTAFENSRRYKSKLLFKRGGSVFAENVPDDKYVDSGVQAAWEFWQEAWAAALSQSPATSAADAKDADVQQAMSHIKALTDFAYEQGFHELGYDPVEVVRAAIAASRKGGE